MGTDDTLISPVHASAPITPSELRSIALLSRLTEDEIERVLPLMRRQALAPRRRLNVAVEMQRQVWFSLDARFRVAAALPSGVTVPIYTCDSGQAFGHVAAILEEPFPTTLQIKVERGGKLLVMSAPDFRALLNNVASVGHATVSALASLSKTYALKIVEVSGLDVRARLIGELVRLSQHAAVERGVLTLQDAPTHAATAARIGASREVVTRSLRALELDELIRFRRGVLEFPDLARLKAADRASIGDRFDLMQKNKDAAD